MRVTRRIVGISADIRDLVRIIAECIIDLCFIELLKSGCFGIIFEKMIRTDRSKEADRVCITQTAP